MKLVQELIRQGWKPDQIAAAECHGKPLADVTTKPHKLDGMNKGETDYAALLDWAIRDGTILRYRFGSMKLRLAKRTWYTVDFVIDYASGIKECVEIKGFLRDDAAVKFKVAREMYAEYRWRMIRRTKSGWQEIL